MSRFVTYINESTNIEELKEILSKNCQPYMKDLKKQSSSSNPKILYSGRGEGKDWFKKSVRQNRKPKDTPKEIHELLDHKFKMRFGVKARSSSLFCFTLWSYTKNYGVPYYIFPVGKYSTIWSDTIDDLYEWLKYGIVAYDYNPNKINSEYVNLFRTHTGYDIIEKWDLLSPEEQEQVFDMIELMDIPSYYTNKPYYHMKQKANEIMLVCKEYVAISHAYVGKWFNGEIYNLMFNLVK